MAEERRSEQRPEEMKVAVTKKKSSSHRQAFQVGETPNSKRLRLRLKRASVAAAQQAGGGVGGREELRSRTEISF